MKLIEVYACRRIFRRKKYPEVYLAIHPAQKPEMLLAYPYDAFSIFNFAEIKLYARQDLTLPIVTRWYPSLEDVTADDYEFVEIQADKFWKLEGL